MKYFGKKSLSSVMSVILQVVWLLTLLACLIGPVVAGGVIFFSTSTGEKAVQELAKLEAGVTNVSISHDANSQDARDWEEFRKWPLPLKLLIIPYLMGVLILLLFILGKSKKLFHNFKNDIVFHRSNVTMISSISKLLIAYSIITFSMSTLLLSIVLLLGCEIMKNGTALQEEHDFTV